MGKLLTSSCCGSLIFIPHTEGLQKQPTAKSADFQSEKVTDDPAVHTHCFQYMYILCWPFISPKRLILLSYVRVGIVSQLFV